MTTRPPFSAPRRPSKHGYFYMLTTPDFDGVTIGHTSNPVWRFRRYEFAHGYDLIGVWAFRKGREAEEFEESVKARLKTGELHGLIIPWPGRWTESMDRPSADRLVAEMARDVRLARVTWPDSGPFHSVPPVPSNRLLQ